MLPAAGLPIRLRPGLSRRRSSACAAARPGPPEDAIATFGASAAIASTVSRRGWRRRHGTPMTIRATGRNRGPSQAERSRSIRRAAGVSVRAVAGASVPRSRSQVPLLPLELSSRTSAAVAASVPRPHATSPKPAAPRPLGQGPLPVPGGPVPGPGGGLGNHGGDRSTHPSVVEGLAPSRYAQEPTAVLAMPSSRAIPSLSPWRHVRANTRRRREARAPA